MGVLTFQEETTSPVAPARLYKALLDSDNIIPKVIESFKITVEIVEGNGGPGTIKKITYIEDGETKDALHKIEAIDDANLGYTYSLTGGVRLPDTAEKIIYETKFFAGPNGGSIVNANVKFETKENTKPNEEEIKTLRAKDEALFKAVEAYLLANPDYN